MSEKFGKPQKNDIYLHKILNFWDKKLAYFKYFLYLCT